MKLADWPAMPIVAFRGERGSYNTASSAAGAYPDCSFPG